MPRLRRGYMGKPTPQAKVNACLRARHSPGEGDAPPSYESIAEASGLSKSTICRWDHADTSPSARAGRALRRAWNRTLLREEEVVLAGWVVSCSSLNLPTTSFHLRQFALSAYGVHLSNAWLSRFARRNHLSWRRPERAPLSVRRRETFESATKFLRDIHDLEVAPERLFSLDKTSIYSEPLPLRQLGPKGRWAFSQKSLRSFRNQHLVADFLQRYTETIRSRPRESRGSIHVYLCRWNHRSILLGIHQQEDPHRHSPTAREQR